MGNMPGPDDGDHGRSTKSRSSRQIGGRSSSVVGGGGLVVGIATVVVVGVAGKLFSKFRRPRGSAANNIPPNIPSGNCKIDDEEKHTSPIEPHDETQSENEDSIDGKNVLSPGVRKEGSTENDSNNTETLDREDNPEVHTESLPDCHVESDGGFITQDGKELSAAGTRALSELVSHALQEAKHGVPSESELRSKSEALPDGIAGVISRALEDFGCGETLSDELSPTKLLRVSWETNSSSGSEEDAGAQISPEELLAQTELPNSPKTEVEQRNIEEQVIESLHPDAPTSEQEEEFSFDSLHLGSSTTFENQELKCTRTAIDYYKTDREQEATLEDEAAFLKDESSLSDEVADPKKSDESLQVSRLEDEIKVVSPEIVDDTTALSVDANRASDDDEVVKKEIVSEESAKVPADSQAEIFKLNAETEIFTLTSIPVKSENVASSEIAPPEYDSLSELAPADNSSSEIIPVDKDADSVQISAQIADENEGTSVMTVTSSLVLPVASIEDGNITKIVAAKESTDAAGTHRKTTVVTTTVEFSSSTTGGGLKQELEEKRRGNRLSLELLGLAVIVALVAVLVWSLSSARDNPLVVPGL